MAGSQKRTGLHGAQVSARRLVRYPVRRRPEAIALNDRLFLLSLEHVLQFLFSQQEYRQPGPKRRARACDLAEKLFVATAILVGERVNEQFILAIVEQFSRRDPPLQLLDFCALLVPNPRLEPFSTLQP